MNNAPITELDERQSGVTRSQTLNSIVIGIVAVIMFLTGVWMRSSAQSATFAYLHEESGIRAQLPVGWLITDDDPNFVFQAQDPGATPFKTTLRITIVPVGREATPRNVADTLILRRNVQLSTYRVLAIQEIPFRDGTALQVDYAFVQSEENPFLSSVPVVVLGQDIVIVRGQQAMVITYLEEEDKFEENLPVFENFVNTLRF